MVKCTLCPRELKTNAGLAGHMRIAHPSAVPVDSADLALALDNLDNKVEALCQLSLATLSGVLSLFEGEAALEGVAASLKGVTGSALAAIEAKADAAEASANASRADFKRSVPLALDALQAAGFYSARK